MLEKDDGRRSRRGWAMATGDGGAGHRRREGEEKVEEIRWEEMGEVKPSFLDPMPQKLF